MNTKDIALTDTNTTHLVVTPEAQSLLKGYSIACAVVSGVTVTAPSDTLQAKAEPILSAALEQEGWESSDRIVSMYELYRAFGFNPKKKRPSVAALRKRVKADFSKFPLINSVVGAYNLCSVKQLLPMAAYDFQKLSGAVTLAVAQGGEPHLSIGSEAEEPCLQGELIYHDNAGVLCRGYNWRDAERSKVTDATTELMLFIDGKVSGSEMQEALAELLEMVVAHNGGEVTEAFVRTVA